MISTPLRAVFIAGLLGTTLVSCSGAFQPSEEELEKIAALKEELHGIHSAISAAEEKDALLAGGLVKALVTARLELLKMNEALVEQRIYALESGTEINFDTRGTTPDPERAATLATEIEMQREELARARQEAERYTGGLVSAMKGATVATKEQTLAMLEMEYLIAKYGLATPSLRANAPAAGSSGSATESPSVSQEPEQAFEIVEVDAKVTESNSSWSKFAWKLTMRNLTAAPIALDVTIEFQDSDGFVVDDDSEYGLVVPSGSEKTFTGYDLIDASVAPKVSRVGAKVRRRR